MLAVGKASPTSSCTPGFFLAGVFFFLALP
jgi:hypothetical protein